MVRTTISGKIGIVSLDDQRKRNAIGIRMATDIIAALGNLRA